MLKRSRARLAALAQVDVAALTAEGQAQHEDAVQKHSAAVRLCEERQAYSVVLSNPEAGLMHFPGDGVLPGHRLTLVASGASARLAVTGHLSASGGDQGQLEPAFTRAREALVSAGLPAPELHLEGSADSGFWSADDLRFLERSASWLSLYVKEAPVRGPHAGKEALFAREAFALDPAARTVTCPAGRPMRGPRWNATDRCHVYRGEGCAGCRLRPRCCTRGAKGPRVFSVKWEYEQQVARMRARLNTPQGRAHLRARQARVEPVFASLERDMGFRRLSSRHPPTVHAEVSLKLLAHNLRRLLFVSRRLGAPHLRRGPPRSLH